MQDEIERPSAPAPETRLNLAIVGGDAACRFFLDHLRWAHRPTIAVDILGVCDPDPQAPGVRLAREMGVLTTDNCRRLFELDQLDGILDLTGRRENFLRLLEITPAGIWWMDRPACELLQRLLLLIRDLGRKQQEVAVEKMISAFLFQQADERIVVLDPEFTIVEASEGYLSAVTRSKDRVIGRKCYEITHGLGSPCSEWMPELGCPLLETLRTGRSAHVIHEHYLEGEKPIYCDLETFPIKVNEQGDIVRVIEIWRDITDVLSSRWEMRLNQLRTDLGKLVQEDRLISLGKLSASCVHEINNPIQGLLTFACLMQDILDKGQPTADEMEKFRHYLRLMTQELERCGKITSGLLSFAREGALQTSDVDIRETIQAVISLTRHRMELQDIDLTLELPPEPVTVRGDVHQLQQCLLNLLFNAIEAMPEKGRLKLSLSADLSGREALITVADSGCGIPERHIGKIFDPFYTTKEEGRGTGLGLSIVYGIIKNHNGRIEVDSRIGQGTTFQLHLPLAGG